MVYENIDVVDTDDLSADWIIKGGSTLDLSQEVGDNARTTVSAARLSTTLGTGSVNLNGGNLILMSDAELTNTLNVDTTYANSLTATGTLTLSGTIVMTGDWTNSLDLNGSTVALGESFVLDLNNYELVAGTNYVVFSELATDLSSELITVTNANYSTDDYKLTWAYSEDNELSFSLVEVLKGIVWDSSTGTITGADDGDYSSLTYLSKLKYVKKCNFRLAFLVYFGL